MRGCQTSHCVGRNSTFSLSRKFAVAFLGVDSLLLEPTYFWSAVRLCVKGDACVGGSVDRPSITIWSIFYQIDDKMLEESCTILISIKTDWVEFRTWFALKNVTL